MSSSVEQAAAGTASPDDAFGSDEPAVVVVRTGRGWAVLSPGRAEDVGDLVEGMSLADLVAEEHGALVEPGRTVRKAARGPAGDAAPDVDPRDARLTELERTVAQLEHALAARVSTERAIGVLAERHGSAPRAAFERLRGEARSQGRPVADLAREVLESLECAEPASRPLVSRCPADGTDPASRSRDGRGPAPEGRS
ncbi:ANTAR domain-containing protein [Geodermatophilus sp. CPCC 206100]|uniref:ANTAR domain-containing protein n=1 Tax=Geodermatophilus sp. CPCC 206100 TaxID=3020054 RepID=UPI003B009392